MVAYMRIVETLFNRYEWELFLATYETPNIIL